MQITGNKDLSLYFHIPFCKKKCPYCHFYVIPDKENFQKILFSSLLLELEQKRKLLKKHNIVSIYFGGGTPSLLYQRYLKELLEKVRNNFQLDKNIEITIEANPDDINLEKLQFFKKIGINRLSIGIQTFQERQLNLLGRGHSASLNFEALMLAEQIGFNNISIDLMYDLPSQTLKDLEKDLTIVLTLPISHISLYNLTIEPHTVFFKYKNRIEQQRPSEETSAKMYIKIVNTLSKNGFNHYELSAFCKKTNESKHNVGYWTARPYLGYGPSACSYYDNFRFQNVANINKYCSRLKKKEPLEEFREKLSKSSREKELIVLRLRYLKYINLESFINKKPYLQKESLKEIDALVKEGLIEKQDNKIKLSNKSLLFHDYIAEKLI